MPPHPQKNVDFEGFVPAFPMSRRSSCHPDFSTTKQHCSEGERGKSQIKAKLAEVFQDFWQAIKFLAEYSKDISEVAFKLGATTLTTFSSWLSLA